LFPFFLACFFFKIDFLFFFNFFCFRFFLNYLCQFFWNIELVENLAM
jgi:hypothetical protein